ncbi:RING-H2 finger protein ATL13-like [Diospyros lotus]|uniref:RING-H2 finger protein ATL13-like n=1 Tax=Diospyros lotus TaxID=55363 RepID=UPI0022509E4B|nr:RING-H2 finger protein ATL13-like [Diospyros lotus]
MLSFLSPSQQPYFSSLPPPPPPSSGGFNLDTKVSPSILLIIIILAIIFFISGLLHLLVRILLKPPSRDPDDLDNVTALQGQLQQLFHLHDAGVDQSFIDTLPIFNYKAIIGVKNPFDCAVCLCEFEPDDKLRLLPKCSHAFHMECIDTWLLSHSTCPLCRASLLADFNSHGCSPIVLVLESGGDSSREIVSDSNTHLSSRFRDGFSGEIQAKEDPDQPPPSAGDEKVVLVKLGKFRNVDGEGEGSSNNNIDERRCFSMGSFAYIVDENSSLQVPIRTPMKKQSSKKKASLPLTPGHRPAMSECDCDSRRGFSGFEPLKSIDGVGAKGESFSVSKIWLRGRKEKPNPAAVESSRRAVSFRFPVHWNAASGEELKGKNGGNGTRRAVSEIDFGKWENGGGSDLGFDEENQSRNSLDSQANPPSFARRTLLWLVGKQNQNKVKLVVG